MGWNGGLVTHLGFAAGGVKALLEHLKERLQPHLAGPSRTSNGGPIALQESDKLLSNHKEEIDTMPAIGAGRR